jgi:hypothetical protein
MGNNLTQGTQKTKYEDYAPVRPLAEGRFLMQHK